MKLRTTTVPSINKVIPGSFISNDLLYNYPSDQVFNTTIDVLRHLPKFQINVINEQSGYIQVTALSSFKVFIDTFEINISRHSQNRTNFTITFCEKITNEVVYRQAKHIMTIIQAVSSNLR